MKKISKRISSISIDHSLDLLPSIRTSGVVVGVSGGKDSVTLLNLLVNNLHRSKIFVAHVNHGFREVSNEDEKFVEALSNHYGVGFYSKKLKKPARGNLEELGRKQRYLFFNEVAKKTNASVIATAHTANDVAETILMQLLTNKRLSGMSYFDPKRCLIRPLLNVKRADIDEYVKQNSLTWREDETNTDTQRLRNKMRHIILPFLSETMGSEILDILISQGHFFCEYEQGIELLFFKHTENLSQFVFGSKEWFRKLQGMLSDLPQILGEKLLEEVFLPHLKFRLGRLHRKRLYDFIYGSSLQIELTSGVVLRRKSSGIAIVSLTSKGASTCIPKGC